MLNGTRIYSSDSVWRHILSDFGAVVLDAPNSVDINFDDIAPTAPITPLELKTLILNAGDNNSLIQQIIGDDVSLPPIQAQIIVLLAKSGGMTTSQLKLSLGYAPDVATHTVDTAIYQLRRMFGHSFIINTNGVYTLGEL